MTRCVGFAKSWGYGALVITNLFAFRATGPADMKTAADPIGPENNRYLATVAGACGLVVCGWGNHGAHSGRAAAVLAMLRGLGVVPHALGLTSLRQPAHPLYLSAACRPFRLEVTA
jgi:hypothetical protein